MAAHVHLAGARVLVVDDSEANRRFACFLVKRLGCAATAVTDGDEAVPTVAAAAAAGAPFDVVLMDLVMVCRACVKSTSVGTVCCISVAQFVCVFRVVCSYCGFKM